MRYRLEELGWYQFENLASALLKAEVGLGLEVWSAPSGDLGRDAYFKGALRFPTHDLSDGPFVFQVKFSAADDSDSSLRTAVAKEKRAIQSRRGKGEWQDCAHYCLLTNVSLTPTRRTHIEDLLKDVQPASSVHVLGGDDICAILDRHPQIRRSFPQLLGLADLSTLIDEVLNRDSRERSNAAIELARRYVTTFVPTGAYEKAWGALRTHSFAVLTGPPEMGKTTIAWMISLSQVAMGWQAHLCRTPNDFFAAYSADVNQVFVADDAFGRTEYDPALVTAWERDLHLILPKLDTRHWLIWTSRKHLLERARQKMDLQAPATRFPDPASVIVESRKLSREEKALILYRHAKAHLPSSDDRRIVKAHCLSVVGHSAFTPERIRSFIDWLPHAGLATLPADAIKSTIHSVIDNPTERMRKAYGSLAQAHKWILVALLEEPYGAASSTSLKERYERQCPVSDRKDFEPLIDQLVDAFVFLTDHASPDKQSYSWIHPSYRDLVIDELSSDDGIRKHFIATTDYAGVTLAISSLGGTVGGRSVPLLRDEDDWERFSTRIQTLIAASSADIAAMILVQFSESIESENRPEIRRRLVTLLGSLCDTLRASWDNNATILDANHIKAFSDASRWLERIPPLPDLSRSWEHHVASCALEAEQAHSGEWFDPRALSRLVDLVEVIRGSEPRLLAKVGFPSAFEKLFSDLEVAMAAELESDPDLDDVDAIENRASQLDDLASSLRRLGSSDPSGTYSFKQLSARMSETAEELRSELPHEPDFDNGEGSGKVAAGFDITAIFSDL